MEVVFSKERPLFRIRQPFEILFADRIDLNVVCSLTFLRRFPRPHRAEKFLQPARSVLHGWAPQKIKTGIRGEVPLTEASGQGISTDVSNVEP